MENYRSRVKKLILIPTLITDYWVLTTGSRDTSVQNSLNSGGAIYTRLDDEVFNVRVFYLDEFKVQNIVPNTELNRFFPDVFPVSVHSEIITNKNNEYIQSLKELKEFISTVITAQHLDWLESWDFSIGYVSEYDYSDFHELYIEYHRTLDALDGIKEWLKQGDRTRLAQSLYAGSQFYKALSEFVKSINGIVIGHNLTDGASVLWVGNIQETDKNKITNRWRANAHNLAQVYRLFILGESEYA